MMMAMRMMLCISGALTGIERLILQHHCSAKHHVFWRKPLKLEKSDTSLAQTILWRCCRSIVIENSSMLFIDKIEALDVLHTVFDYAAVVVFTSRFLFQ